MQTFSKQEASLSQKSAKPNVWDAVAFLFIFSIIFALAWLGLQMAQPYKLGDALIVSLKPSLLPYYAFCSVGRMFIALFFSFLFTFIFGTLAARYKTAEQLIIPIIDIMQSIPVLGILPIAVWGGIMLFPNNRLGPECAALVAIFTSQVWNMILSFYQSLKTVPIRLKETSQLLQLNRWQYFWRVEVPFAMPGLIWNTMISMSAGWVFVVAAESISIAHQKIALPGIGSYIAKAIVEANIVAIGYAIIAMFFVIVLYDLILFRPIVQWTHKFKMDSAPHNRSHRSWVATLFYKTQLMRYLGTAFEKASETFVAMPVWEKPYKRPPLFNTGLHINKRYFLVFKVILYFTGLLLLTLLIMYMTPLFYTFMLQADTLHLFYLGAVTTLRIGILIALCLFIWVPVGVWIGLRPNAMRLLQPIVQILAAFPANLLFPLVAITIVHYHLNVNIWTSPLMILGTQWYILFNVIAGTSKLPKSLIYAADTLHLTSWVRWRRLILPGILPDLVTGMMTAAGGAWNASIIAEAVDWGTIQLRATGLGAAITDAASTGSSAHLALSITIMSVYVLMINHFLWRPLYRYAQRKEDNTL